MPKATLPDSGPFLSLSSAAGAPLALMAVLARASSAAERTKTPISWGGRPEREGLLEDALAEVADEEQAVRPTIGQRGEEVGLGHAQVLRLGDHDELVGPGAVPQLVGEPAEDVRPGHQLALGQGAAEMLKDRPQDLALVAADPGLAAETRDVAIGLPGLQLPGIDHVGPFGEQEWLGELVLLDRRHPCQERVQVGVGDGVRLAKAAA